MRCINLAKKTPEFQLSIKKEELVATFLYSKRWLRNCQNWKKEVFRFILKEQVHSTAAPLIEIFVTPTA
jgi:hypothetical protein